MSRTAWWRPIALVLAGGLVLSACAAAGDGDDAAGPPDKLVVWTYYGSASGQIEALNQQNALWKKKHPDIPIEHVPIPFDQLPSKLLATAATQSGPDVVIDNVVVDFPALAAGGVLADMTDYWESYEDSALFSDSAIWTYEDTIYNVMSYTNLLALYYNKDILDEYGIAPPSTVEEFEAAMQKVAADGKYTPLSESAKANVEGAWMFMPLLLGQGVDYCNFETAVVRGAFERADAWAQREYVPREAVTWDQNDAFQQFLSGEYAFGVNGNWNIPELSDASFEVGTTRFPAGPEGSHVFPGGEGIGIGAFSEHKDVAWEYIETAWLSKEASLINLKASGQIPTRSDLAEHPAITENTLVQPFVEAAADTSAWPLNEETAAMQEAVGAAHSAVISGQKSAGQAAQEAVSGVAQAREKGGGSC